jgi:hypothetical protein
VEIVCESYIITVQTAKYGSSPWSLEHIGALRQIMMDAGMDYENLPLQSSQSIKKSSFTNPALKKLGYWHRGGKGHALDAIRHGLLYITKEGWTASGILS